MLAPVRLPRSKRLQPVCALAFVGILTVKAGLAAPLVPSDPARSSATAELAPVRDTVGKEIIIDNYRWMEDQPQRLGAYLHAQTDMADSVINRIAGRERLLKAMDSLDAPGATISAVTPDGDTLYYLRQGPNDDVAKLVERQASGGDETVLVDPEAIPGVQPHSEIDQFTPAVDGTFVAYGMEYAGPNTSTLRIYDAVRHTTLSEHIDGARFAQVTWLPDSAGFYYTHAIAPEGAAPVGRPSSHGWGHLGVFLHLLGHDPATDQLVLDGAKLPFPFSGASAFPRILIVPESTMALAIVSDGASPNLTIATVPLAQVREQPAPWQLVAAQADGVTQIVVNGSIAFLLTSAHADKMRVVTEDLADPGFDRARIVIPESDGVITGIAASRDALYVARRQGTAMHLLRLDLEQTVPEDVHLPFDGTIAPAYGVGTAREWGGLVADPRVDGAYFSLESWAHPLTWLRYDLRIHRVLNMMLVPDPKVDFKAYEALSVMAQATDGTAIPMTVIARRGVAMDHARPTLVSAFGSFGYAFDPRYMPMALAWADQGGVFAIAHVRGGGELGESWHQAGTLARKITTATDLLACASALIKDGYTDPAHLAGMGTNAGALAIGNAITLQPGLFRAALIRAGLNNPLRAQDQPGHDSDILELGDVTIPLQQAAVLSIDPYMQVKDGVAYPAVLLTSSVNDGHEPVWETAKMAARLQAATTSGRPVLMRITFDEGSDGPTRAQRDTDEADEMSFLLWQLGAPGFEQGIAPSAGRKARHGRRR
jgi:prolyl oligopeptidase